VVESRIEHTQCCVCSADEGIDVGMDEGTPVMEDYKEHDNKFSGKIQRVTIELKPLKTADHAEAKTLRAEATQKNALAD
jgi:hypothetical protein